MALTWDWKKVSGTITETIRGMDVTFNFYEGNALMIVLHEYKDDDGTDMYNLHWFFSDETHCRRCLGLEKGCDSMFEPGEVKRLVIYRENCRQWEKIVWLFAKAFPDMEIVIRATKEEEDGKTRYYIDVE